MERDNELFSPGAVKAVTPGLWAGVKEGGVPKFPDSVTWTDDGTVVTFYERETMKEIFRADRDGLAYMGLTLDDVATGTVLCVLSRVANRWRGNDILHPQPW